MFHPFASSFLLVAMTGLPVLVAGSLVLTVWSTTQSKRTAALVALGLTALMMAQQAIASAGVLRDWSRRPPLLMLVIMATIALTVAFAFSKTGKTIACQGSCAFLVLSQAFRLPLELIMNRAAEEGVMPVQMSYSGWNFDIFTGLSAFILGIFLATGRSWPGAVRVWNLVGFCLLLNIVGIAIFSLPPIAAFGPSRLNVWITYPPFIWLPGVLVPSALLGHILIWRKLGSATAT